MNKIKEILELKGLTDLLDLMIKNDKVGNFQKEKILGEVRSAMKEFIEEINDTINNAIDNIK